MALVPIYDYLHKPFRYVFITSFTTPDKHDSRIVYHKTVIYNMTQDVIVWIGTPIHEVCNVVDTIESNVLLQKLHACCEKSLSYIVSNEWTLHRCCIAYTLKYLCQLLKTVGIGIHELKALIKRTKHPLMSYLYIRVLEDALQEEAEKRFILSSANIIKKHWKSAVSNPYHPIGKRRLQYEFNDLAGVGCFRQPSA